MIIRTPPKLTNRSVVTKYVEVDLWSWLRELVNGLFTINFKDNFQSFTVSNLKIPAGSQVAINNEFSRTYNGLIPSGRLITRQQGNAVINDGNEQWNAKQVFLNNPSENDTVVSVIFFA